MSTADLEHTGHRYLGHEGTTLVSIRGKKVNLSLNKIEINRKPPSSQIMPSELALFIQKYKKHTLGDKI